MSTTPMDPFRFHTGQSYSFHPHADPLKSQYSGNCPFCGKDEHFSFNTQWQWDCKKCHKEGNIYAFIRMWHETKCTYQNVDKLAADRKIPLGFFRLTAIKWNPANSSFVIPTFRDGKMNYLYKVIYNPEYIPTQPGKASKYLIRNMPGIDTTLFSWPENIHNDVWLCEGLWDRLAAEAIIGSRDVTCMGYPGSGFKNTWTQALAGKRVYVFGDNDPGGTGNIEQIIKRIEASPQKPIEVCRIDWSKVPTLPDGYDLNDVWVEHGHASYEWVMSLFNKIEDLGKPLIDSPIQADVTCKTFDELVGRCKESYYFTSDMELLLLLMLSSIYSLRIEGEQLWLRVIGPPGSSKTTLARVVGSSESTILRDTFTGLLSGWKDDDASDASLIPMITNKALIVKEADALLRQPNYDQIMSQLRAFYDKDIAATYLNRVNINYKNIRCSFVLCGTHVLRGIDNVALGDRFLDFELHVSEDDKDHISDKMLDRSIEAGESGKNPENKVWEAAKGFIDHYMSCYDGVAKIDKSTRSRIKDYSKLIAYMRAKVQRDRSGNILYRPHAEVPSRLIGQLVKLYQCAPRVLNLETPNDLVHKLASRLTIDIIDRESHRYRICSYLSVAPGRTRDQIHEATGISMYHINKELDDMDELKFIRVDKYRTSSQTSINTISLHEPIAERIALVMENTK